MSESSIDFLCPFRDAFDRKLNLNRNRFFGFLSISSLSEPRLTPTIKSSICIDCHRMRSTTSDISNWIFSQHFNSIFWSRIVLKEMGNVLWRRCCLDFFQLAKLTLKSSSPTVNVSDIAKCQRMMETACDWYDFFIFELGNPLWRRGKYSTSESQRSKVIFPVWEKKPICGKNNIMLLTTLDLRYFMSLQWLYNLINWQRFFLIVLNKILIFWMNGSHNMLFII